MIPTASPVSTLLVGPPGVRASHSRDPRRDHDLNDGPDDGRAPSPGTPPSGLVVRVPADLGGLGREVREGDGVAPPGEVERVGQVLGLAVAHGHGLEVPAPLDHLQHRAVLVRAGLVEPLLGEGTHHDRGHPEAESLQVGLGPGTRQHGVVFDPRRGDVVVEAAALVEVEDEDQLVPVRAVGQGVVDLGHEGLGHLHAAVGVVVVRGAVELGVGGVVRVHEHDVGQRPRLGVVEELADVVRDVVVLLAGEEARHGLAEVVVAGGQAGVLHPVEDGEVEVHRSGLTRGGVDAGDVEVRGRAELVEAVGPGRSQHRGEVLVERGVALHQGGEDGEVVGLVVADGEQVAVGLGLEEPVAGAVVVVRLHGLPQVDGVLHVAALPVGGELVGLVRVALLVDEAQTGLLAVGAGEPTDHVVERPVLHHQHHDGVEGSVARVGQRGARLVDRAAVVRGAAPRQTEGGQRGRCMRGTYTCDERALGK